MNSRDEVIAPHSNPVLPMPPGIPALSFTNHSFCIPETSRRVCITVGAQCPIRIRFAALFFQNLHFACMLSCDCSVSSIGNSLLCKFLTQAIGLLQIILPGGSVYFTDRIEVNMF